MCWARKNIWDNGGNVVQIEIMLAGHILTMASIFYQYLLAPSMFWSWNWKSWKIKYIGRYHDFDCIIKRADPKGNPVFYAEGREILKSLFLLCNFHEAQRKTRQKMKRGSE